MWLLSLLALAVLLAWFLLRSVVSFLLPLEKTGKALLAKEFERIGISARAIPETLYAECIDVSIQKLRLVSGGKLTRRAAFVKDLRLTSDIFSKWLQNPSDPEWQSLSSYKALFERHIDSSK